MCFILIHISLLNHLVSTIRRHATYENHEQGYCRGYADICREKQAQREKNVRTDYLDYQLGAAVNK